MRKPEALMIFAAGFGTRMGDLTADRPKPLIEAVGKPLIDHALDVAFGANAGPIVVNLHYRGDQLARHLEGRGVHLSWERDEILETGGGLRQALPLLGSDPVLTLNSDAVWTGANPLKELRGGWTNGSMDALLLLAPASEAKGHFGPPDFTMEQSGRIAPYAGSGGPGYIYLGAQIIRTDRLHAIPERAFSMWRLWTPMIEAGKAFGLVHHGGWCDVGSPAGLHEAERLLGKSQDV